MTYYVSIIWPKISTRFPRWARELRRENAEGYSLEPNNDKVRLFLLEETARKRGSISISANQYTVQPLVLNTVIDKIGLLSNDRAHCWGHKCNKLLQMRFQKSIGTSMASKGMRLKSVTPTTSAVRFISSIFLSKTNRLQPCVSRLMKLLEY